MAGDSNKKGNILTIIIIIILVLTLLGVIFNSKIKDYFTADKKSGDEAGQVVDKQTEPKPDSEKQAEPKPDEEKQDAEAAASNIIDDFILEAKKLAEELEYKLAIEKLDEASEHKEPEPSDMQKEEIAKLRADYEKALQEQIEQARDDQVTQEQVTGTQEPDKTDDVTSSPKEETTVTRKQDVTPARGYIPRKRGPIAKSTKTGSKKRIIPRSTDEMKTSRRKPRKGRITQSRKTGRRTTPVNVTPGPGEKTTPQPYYPAENPIDLLITEAKRLGDVENDYTGALSKLEEAKNYDDPNPTLEQQEEIDELMEKYKKALDEASKTTEPAVGETGESRESDLNPDNKIDITDPTNETLPDGGTPPTIDTDIGNIIDELIKEARRLGDDEQNYPDALAKLNEAKNYKEPEPTQEQDNTIDELIRKYTIIDKMIAEAKELGDGQRKYAEAIAKLREAKDYTNPNPIPRQDDEIDKLLKKYEGMLGDEETRRRMELAEDFFKKGMQALKEDKYDLAIEFFNKALEYNPEHVLAHSYKGTAYYMKNQDQEALDASDKALALDSTEPNAHFTKGEIFYKNYKDPEAKDEYTKVIEKDSDNAYALFKLGVLELLDGQNEKGIDFMNRAIEITPGLNNTYRRNAYYDRGVGKERMGNLDEAEADYKKALELDNAYSKAYIQLGEIYYKKKDYDTAITYLEKGLSENPNNYDLAFLIGKVYDTKGDTDPENYDKALEYYNKAVEAKPNSMEALCNAGRLYLKRGDYSQAITYYERASQIKEDEYGLNVDYAAAYLGLKQYDQSIQKYEKALQINDEKIDAYIGMGAVYFARSKKDDGTRDEQDLKKAQQYLEKANSINSEIFEVNKALGTIYYNLKQYDQAITALEKAVSLKENDYLAQRNLATTYFTDNRFSDSIPHYLKAVEIKDDDSELYLRLGEAYYKTGDKQNAKTWFNKLVDRYPEYKDKRQVRIYLRAVEEN